MGPSVGAADDWWGVVLGAGVAAHPLTHTATSAAMEPPEDLPCSPFHSRIVVIRPFVHIEREPTLKDKAPATSITATVVVIGRTHVPLSIANLLSRVGAGLGSRKVDPNQLASLDPIS